MSERFTFSLPQSVGNFLRTEIISAFAGAAGIEDHSVTFKVHAGVTRIECSREMGHYYLEQLDELGSAAAKAHDQMSLQAVAVAKGAIIGALYEGTSTEQP